METPRSVDNDGNAYQDWHAFHYSVPGSWSSVTARTTPNSSADFVTIHSTSSTEAEDPEYPRLRERGLTEDDLARVRSHRRSQLSEREGESREDWLQIEKLISRMFGQERRATSEEDRTKHVGVVWRNLTVQGVGLGAAIQPTNGLLLMRLPRLIIRSLTRSKKGTAPVKPPVRTILDDFTGCVRPGEMLLVLGRPGSGCSTFLKVIGNQRAGYKDIDGEVCYGGTDAETMAKMYRSEVLYNPEDDLHYASLTVRDTLMFALKTKTPDKASRIPGETREDYQNTFLSAIAKLFWIEHALGTKVGNALIRGISGGEKKRVSIGEAMVAKASTQCWDNSTKGLDANTALEYVQSLRSLTNTANISTLVALYQASENLYNLFDKVILIEEGKCAYFGRTEDAKAYFEGLGFECPPRWTTADFLTSISDPNARHVKSGWEHRVPRSSDEFQKAYRNSHIFESTMADIEEFEEEVESQEEEREDARSKTPKKNYTVPFHKQVLILTHRQFLIMFGDRQSLVGKWGMIVFLALIIGSVFYNIPKTSAGVFTRGGVLFLILLFNSLLAMAELTTSFDNRPILLKQKSFSFYRPSAYALAQVVVDIPLVFIQVTLFNLVVYFMANLARTASQFFTSLLLIFVLTMTMYSYFRALGSLCASLDVATRITGVSIQALIVYTGYLIPTWKMHPWFKWLIWINPVQYSFEALIANEFHNMEIKCVPPYIVPDGPDAVAGHQGCTIAGSTPDQLVVQGSRYIEAGFNYSRSHLWRNLGILIGFFVLFVVLTMIGMERQKPNEGGGAVTVFKKGETPKPIKNAVRNGGSSEDLESGEKDTAVSHMSSGQLHMSGAKGHGIAKNTSVFTWKDVNYTIPYEGGQKKLLRDVQGYVKPGRLTALMGASGAGKTTLLNTLAQRNNFGVVTGSFLVDGKPLPKRFQRATGFAEQMDIHEPTATVRESLRFSALLRQPKDVPIEEKYAYCENIIDLLEMRDIAGATVGTVGSGLNPEQRKRLTIAVELASKPELLLFLDEPTSGLDSLAAFNIVRFLRRLADAGQAVLCTIHQPSAVLFEEFDDLLLLQKGGQVVYNGELGQDSKTLIDYFERNGGKQCPSTANPAEYMLEVIGAGNPEYKGQDWGEVWAASPENRQLSEEIETLNRTRRRKRSKLRSKNDSEFATSLWTQIKTVTKRSFVSYWRSPQYVMGKFMLHIITGLFNTFTFWRLGNSYIDMQSRLFSIFMTFIIAPPLVHQLQPRYLHYRDLYQSREANSKIYSWVAFVISTILPELPYSIIAGTIYFNCWYWGIGFPRDSFRAGYVWMTIMLFEMFYIGFGQFIAALAPNEAFASLLVPAFFTFVISFCGAIVPYRSLPHFWQSWMYWLTPFHYLLESLLGVLAHDAPVKCLPREMASFTPPQGQTCREYAQKFAEQAGGYVTDMVDGLCSFCQFSSGDHFAATFNIFYAYAWRNYGIFIGYVLFNFVLVFLFSWIFLHGIRNLKRWLSTRKANAIANAKVK